MQRKLLYLVNPISGGSAKSKLQQLISERTASAALPYAIYPSVANGDYSYLYPVIAEEGFTDIIIVGGDGTINQAINSLRGQPVRFGILPCGSGNGLAFSAKIPKNKDKALDIVFAGKSSTTDAFLINDTFACMLCGLGLDAQVAHDFAHDPKRGLRTYMKKTLSNFLTAKPYPFVLTSHGTQIETEAFFISIANSNQFGNHFTIAPKASLGDGLLDIVVMTQQNKLSMLVQALKQVAGYNELKRLEVVKATDDLIYFQTNELSIHNIGSAPMHIDGDPVETAEQLHIKVIPGCFELIHG